MSVSLLLGLPPGLPSFLHNLDPRDVTEFTSALRKVAFRDLWQSVLEDLSDLHRGEFGFVRSYGDAAKVFIIAGASRAAAWLAAKPDIADQPEFYATLREALGQAYTALPPVIAGGLLDTGVPPPAAARRDYLRCVRHVHDATDPVHEPGYGAGSSGNASFGGGRGIPGSRPPGDEFRIVGLQRYPPDHRPSTLNLVALA